MESRLLSQDTASQPSRNQTAQRTYRPLPTTTPGIRCTTRTPGTCLSRLLGLRTLQSVQLQLRLASEERPLNSPTIYVVDGQAAPTRDLSPEKPIFGDTSSPGTWLLGPFIVGPAISALIEHTIREATCEPDTLV
ncbi:hypothetical protein ASPCADRAFT_210845 [Aspergillus carbonarius ITEM 5010]|uniref:Uncharacterized protein n=1 Tax=Aspergillus carbonarius (strain ITEM 5010) TaxID=602072 RepID=A0A1R3RBU6_ASPC5|nr:hypothetical protein ASPCADRAFT_210845 [Aspergillus carbonarius ITEM 5010]